MLSSRLPLPIPFLALEHSSYTPHHTSSSFISHKVYYTTMSTALSAVNVMGRQGVRRLMISSTTNSSVLFIRPFQHGVISVGLQLSTLDKVIRNSSTLPRAMGRLETDAPCVPPAGSCGLGTKTDIAANVSEDDKRPVDRSEVRVRTEFRDFQAFISSTAVRIQEERSVSISPTRVFLELYTSN